MRINPNLMPVFIGVSVEEIGKIPKLLAELQEMSRNCEEAINSINREVYLGVNRPRVKEIGHILNMCGGYPLMFWVAQQIPLHDQRELDCAWHEIGKWRS